MIDDTPKKTKPPQQIVGGTGSVVAPVPKIHGSDAPKISGAGGVAFIQTGVKTSTPDRVIWYDNKRGAVGGVGGITDQQLADTRKISLRSIANFKAGRKQNRETRRGLAEAFEAEGIPCTLEEIPL